jgi:biotin synthase
MMPNVTPTQYRASYELYPDKICLDEDAAHCLSCVQLRLAELGRSVGKGPGHVARLNSRPNER